jgi:hypothetical protein
MGLKLRAEAHTDSERLTLEQWASAGQLFALIDPFFELPNQERRARLETRDTDPSFYEGIAWDQVTYVPPYLCTIGIETLRLLLDSMPTERWGILIASHQRLEILAQHFQKFVIAKGPDGSPYFLRFHDAAVLDVLIGTWSQGQKAIFFGPALAFGLPDLDSMRVVLREHPFGQSRVWKAPKPEDCLLSLEQAQLLSCAQAIERDLVRVIYWHLRIYHSKAVQFLDKTALQERIHHAIARARSHGLGAISDLAGFAALMFELAPNFDEHPAFRSVLNDGSISSELKLKKLSNVITDREWNEAARLYDRDFWPRALRLKRSK